MLRLLIPSRMTLSAEAIIGLIALFIACIPGIRFIPRRHKKFRQLWNRADGAAFPLVWYARSFSTVSSAPTLIAPYLQERTGFAIPSPTKVSGLCAPTLQITAAWIFPTHKGCTLYPAFNPHPCPAWEIVPHIIQATTARHLILAGHMVHYQDTIPRRLLCKYRLKS
jgi:hypothetical protein